MSNAMTKSQKLSYYLNRSFALTFFVSPIYITYLLSAGLNYTQISLLHITRDISIFIFEVPFGILADRVGRKFMIYVSGVLAILTMISFVYQPVFSFFLAAFAFWGAAIAADSGTVSAMVYEAMPDKEQYKTVVSNSEVFKKLTQSIANFFGSILYLINIALPFLASIFLTLIPLIAGYFIPDSKIKKIPRNTYISKIKELFTDKNFLIPMITLSMMVSSFSLAFVYEQPILQNRGVDVKYFGIIFGGFLVIGMVGSYYLRYFNLKKSIDKSYVVLTGLMAIVIYFMSFHKGFIIPLLAMILLALLNGLVYPMKFIVMNSLITSDEIRSGVLSIESYLEFLSKSIISILSE